MKLNTVNLADVDVTRPVISDGIFHCRLSAEVKENSKKTGTNLVLMHEILDEVTKRDTGEPLQRKITIPRTISMVPTEKYDPNENYKRLAEALELEEGRDLRVEDLQGAVVKCKVTHKPAQGDYPEGNDINAWFPKDDDFVDPQM